MCRPHIARRTVTVKSLNRSADLGESYLADEEIGTRRFFPHSMPDGIECPRGDLILFVKYYRWRGRCNLKLSA